MASEYEWNQQAEIMATGIIQQYHKHLIGLKVAYLFKQRSDYENKNAVPKTKRMRQGKKVTLARARMVTKIYADLLQQDFKFIIEFDRDHWDLLSLEQQRALVDHEISHCGNDAEGCYLKHHDLEEFRGIVERHGLWKADIEAFANSIEKQRTLALD